jgi:imidazolonepropionase-like amidohydrolase
VGVRPSRRCTPSRNSSADRSEPLRRLGKVVSHAPVEVERLMRLLSRGAVAVERMAVSVASLWSRFRILASERAMEAVFRCSCVQRGVPLMRESVRRLVISVEAEY